MRGSESGHKSAVSRHGSKQGGEQVTWMTVFDFTNSSIFFQSRSYLKELIESARERATKAQRAAYNFSAATNRLCSSSVQLSLGLVIVYGFLDFLFESLFEPPER